jgi:signal transduction histidine kinase
MALSLHADILADELDTLDASNRAQLRRSLTVMRDNMLRSYELMQHYLLVVRVQDAPREPVELGTYIDTWCAEMRAHLAARGLTLRWEIEGTLGYVGLHQPSFRQALSNLLDYAEASMPEPGTVTFRGHRFPGHVCLEVHETPVRLSPEEVATLFDLGAKTRPPTPGLGLVLTREVVRAHLGEITVTSLGEAGVTFTITLPLLDAARRQSDTPEEH